MTHEQREEVAQARSLYTQILKSFPENSTAKDRLEALSRKVDLPPERLASLFALSERKEYVQLAKSAIALIRDYPNSYMLWALLGSAEHELGQFEHAEKCARKALSFRPRNALAHYNLANALRAQDKVQEALECYADALNLDPNLAIANHNRAMLLFREGDIEAALHEWRIANETAPDFAEAHYGSGICLFRLGKYEEAVASFQRAVELNPKLVEAYLGLGNAYNELGDLPKAGEALDMALELNPDDSSATSLRAWIQSRLCDFAGEAKPINRAELNPFSALFYEDDPKEQQLRSQAFWRQLAGGIRPFSELPRPKYRPDQLKIGYFSADFHDHATLHLLSGVLREHDRTGFEIHAYSYGRQASVQFRDLLNQRNLHFHYAEGLSDETFAELARSHQLDIAIDLKGYTAETRSQIFGYRLAPIQMNYLGYPSTLGTDVFDYIVADRMLIPSRYRKYYDEKVLYLPHSYQPNDNLRRAADISTPRSEFGLPERGMVFCCFNNSTKIKKDEFDIWMRVLAQVEGSVLWLLRTDDGMEGNLRKSAEASGVASDRLIFCDRAPHALHLARHRHADLFLDTFNCNAHTTGSDALWAGLPLITMAGKQFAARVAASLLNAVGLPELITESKEEYEARILHLATHRTELREIRERLARNRFIHPLFDTRRYTRNLENGFRRAYERYLAGEPPADIRVLDQS
ncbi:MAG: tetratricopeptide repeat protein [Rhizobiaceae bacterium]|nr:tetratricopeptide repeat protein [Rhizobiaceae bacterium]